MALVCVVAAFLILDFVSVLSTCQKPQQEKSQESTEKGCGFAQSLIYREAEIIFEWIDRRHDLVTAAATIVIALFTFTLWRATDRLWDAGERQLAHLNETAERQLRAYVNIIKIIGRNLDDRHAFTIEIRNYGQTPAYDVRTEGAIVLTTQTPLEHELALPADPPFIGGAGTLAPGAENHIRIEIKPPLSNEELDQVRLGTKAIYIFGRIRYIDAFNHHRQTSFRYLIGGGELISPTGNCAIAREGNEAT